MSATTSSRYIIFGEIQQLIDEIQQIADALDSLEFNPLRVYPTYEGCLDSFPTSKGEVSCFRPAS